MDLVEGDSDIAFGSPKFPGPAPDVAEHPLVEIADEFLGEHVSFSTKSPVLTTDDVLLFHLVEVSTKGDVGRDEVSHLFWRERCGVVGLVEDRAHWLIPEEAGAGLVDDFIEALVDVPSGYLLVLQQHGMFDWLEAFACEGPGSVPDGLFEGFTGHESVDESAIESFGHSSQGCQFDGSFGFRLLHRCDGWLLDAQASR